MTAKLRIKAGSVEMELETDGALSLDDIKSLLHEVEALSPVAATAQQAGDSTGAIDSDNSIGIGGGASKTEAAQRLHVTSIAAKLGVKTAADLARAAAAHLQLTEGKETFTRQELLLAMKKAPKFYKANMSKNLSSIITSLIPDTLNQIGEDVYSLTAAGHAELETVLA
jgi:hypothetical protein